MENVMKNCPECGSNKLSWCCQKVNVGMAIHGRLCLHEIGVIFVLGCDECSETIDTKSGDDIAAIMTDMLIAKDQLTLTSMFAKLIE